MGNYVSQGDASASREAVVSGTFDGTTRTLYLDSKTKEYTWHTNSRLGEHSGTDKQLFHNGKETDTAVTVDFNEIDEIDNPDMIIADRNDEKVWASFSEPINLASRGTFVHIPCPLLKGGAPETPLWWFRSNVEALRSDYIFGFKPKGIKCLTIEPVNQPYFRVVVWVLTLNRVHPIILRRGYDFDMKDEVYRIPAITF